MKEVSVVGIAGGTASGKSTIVSYIKEFFKDDIELICHDSYYKANDDKTNNGISTVIVNGKIALQDGVIFSTGAGRVL